MKTTDFQIIKTKEVLLKYPSTIFDSIREMVDGFLDCFQKGECGIIEYPIKNEKSLAIISTSLAHIQYSSVDKIVIAFKSLDHMKKVLIEYHRFTSIYDTPIVVLGFKPKESLNSCTKQDVHIPCRKRGHCGLLEEAETFSNYPNLATPFDLEETNNSIRDTGECPYYMMQEKFKNAKIVFCPTNHLINFDMIHYFKTNLNNSIIVINEANDIENVCSESMCSSITLQEIKITEAKLKQIRNNKSANVDCILLRTVTKIILWAEHETILKLPKLGFPVLGKPKKIKEISSIYKNTQLKNVLDNFGDIEDLELFFEYAFSPLEQKEARNGILNNSDTGLIKELAVVLKNILENESDFFLRFLLVPVVRGENISYRRTLCFRCLNPALAFKKLRENVISVVLTSSTAYPKDMHRLELGTVFPIELSMSNVIQPYQCKVFTVSSHRPENNSIMSDIMKDNIIKGKDDRPPFREFFGSSVNSRKTCYQLGVIQIIIETALKIQSGGILVFFNTYDILGFYKQLWIQGGILENIRKTNNVSVMFDSIEDGESHQAISQYKDACRIGTGTVIFLSVGRGRIIEEKTFTDSESRVVFVVSIPLQSPYNYGIRAKMEWLDSREDGICKNVWYEHQVGTKCTALYFLNGKYEYFGYSILCTRLWEGGKSLVAGIGYVNKYFLVFQILCYYLGVVCCFHPYGFVLV